MKSVVILIAILVTSFSVLAEPLTIVTENFRPFNYSENGEAKGLSTEIVQSVLEELGLDVDILFYPWPRAYKLAQQRKNTLIYSIARIKEREHLFEWVGVIAPYRTSFYKLKSNNRIKINSLEDAKEYSVGVSLEDVILTFLKGQDFTNLNIVSKDILNIRMLAHGRLDLIAYEEASFLQKIRSEGFEPEMFERVFQIEDLTGDLYMAFSPGSDPVFINSFRGALATIKKKGIYDRIHSKFLLP